MDYEKAYNEALERAKNMIDDLRKGEDILAVSELEAMFPELRESEDERIRKELVDYFASYKIGNVTTKLNGVRIDDILNYLEKQKELPFVKDVVLGYPGLYFYDGERMHFQGSPAMEENKEKEKPLSEDERIRKGLVKLLTVASEAYLVESTGIKKESYLAWLEKQKENPKSCDSIPSDCASDAKCEDRSPKHSDFPAGFYVTLPDGKKYYTKEMRCNGMNVKVVEPKPAEWSEEDELNLNWVIEILNGHPCELDIQVESLIYWLKSLRPSWKPSEEQMKALDKAIPVCIGVVGRDEVAPLESLYEQLKKL